MNRSLSHPLTVLALALQLGCVGVAHADNPIFHLKLEDHRFEPQSIEIPAHTKVKLMIVNRDGSAEEFDSDDLHREKVITPGMEAAVYIGPLDPGIYRFKGEYHPDTATGMVIVK